jgi:ABC-type amino acid transport substrate-binding protein
MKKILLALLLCLSAPAFAADAPKESAYDRVMRTGVIRCGYVHWEPALRIDPNTHKISGPFHDLAEEIGRRLSLKIEWTEETGWATAIEGLVAGRYDAVCSAFFPTPARGRRVGFSQAAFFSPIYLWTKPGSPLIGKDRDALNAPGVTFAYMDGTALGQITERDFPQAKKVTYPENMPFSDLIAGVENGKGDVAMIAAENVGEYLKTHPGSLVRVSDTPLAAFPDVMLLPMDDARLKSMVDTTIRDILYDGTIQQILTRNGLKDTYLPVKFF